jgi:hypothetical protein
MNTHVVPPPPGGDDDPLPWDYKLRAAVIEAWSDPARLESWHVHTIIDPNRPNDTTEARRVEYQERLRELDGIFSLTLAGTPLTRFSASHLWMLGILIDLWRELVDAEEVPDDMRPPAPDPD